MRIVRFSILYFYVTNGYCTNMSAYTMMKTPMQTIFLFFILFLKLIRLPQPSEGTNDHIVHAVLQGLGDLLVEMGRKANAEAAVGADVAGHRDQFIGYPLCSQDFFRFQGVTDGMEQHYLVFRSFG